MGAKVGLVTGLTFYLVTTFAMEVKLHFIHIWGIEFLLNMGVMYLVSLKFPAKTQVDIPRGPLNLQEWEYAKPLSVALCLVTLMIYYLLGR